MRKRITAAFLPIAALVPMTLALAGSPQADSKRGAIVIGHGSARLLGGDKRVYTTTILHRVATPSKNRTTILKIRAKGLPNPTGKAVHWNFRNTGILCGVFVPNFGYVMTTEWRETVSAAGTAVLTCRVKMPK